MRLVVQPGPSDLESVSAPTPGDSVSVSGCCLTVAEAGLGGWAFDVIPETLSKVWLGSVMGGHRVNIERACTPTTMLGGHVVQGHVDGLASITAVTTDNGYKIRMTMPDDLMQYVTPKGSVAVDGVSLTVATLSVEHRWFEVALIPETLARTTLSERRCGDRVHIETDCMVKAAVHWIRHYGQMFATSTAGTA